MKTLALLLLVPSLAFGQGLTAWERSSTNYCKNSNAMSTGTSANTGWGLYQATVSTVAGAPAYAGGGTWAKVVGITNVGQMYAATTVPSTTRVIESVWMAKESGTGSAGLSAYFGGGTITACACIRSGGGSCTASVVRTNKACSAVVTDLGTAPVRLTILVGLSTAGTGIEIDLDPGGYATSIGTTMFTGGQVEVGNFSGPVRVIPTTTAAKFRKAGMVGAKNL